MAAIETIVPARNKLPLPEEIEEAEPLLRKNSTDFHFNLVDNPVDRKKFQRRKNSPGQEIHLATVDELRNILCFGRYFILSAGENPSEVGKGSSTPVTAKQRHDQLLVDLISLGFTYCQIKGCYGGCEEQSVVVFSPDENLYDFVASLTGSPKANSLSGDAMEIADLGKKYRQECIIHANAARHAMIYTSGENCDRIRYGEQTIIYDSKPDGDHSQVETSDDHKPVFFQMRTMTLLFDRIDELRLRARSKFTEAYCSFFCIEGHGTSEGPRRPMVEKVHRDISTGERKFYLMRGTEFVTRCAIALIDSLRACGLETEAVSTDAHIARVNLEDEQILGYNAGWDCVRGESIQRNIMALDYLFSNGIANVVFDDMNLKVEYFENIVAMARSRGYTVEALETTPDPRVHGRYPAEERHVRSYQCKGQSFIDIRQQEPVPQFAAFTRIAELRSNH